MTANSNTIIIREPIIPPLPVEEELLLPLDAAAETTLNLPKIPGGKKLIYTHLEMPLIALTDLRAQGEAKNDQRYLALADIVEANKGLWCPEAEEYLMANFIKE